MDDERRSRTMNKKRVLPPTAERRFELLPPFLFLDVCSIYAVAVAWNSPCPKDMNAARDNSM